MNKQISRIRHIVANNSQDILTQAFKILICILYQAPRRPEDLVSDTAYESWRTKNMLDDGPSPIRTTCVCAYLAHGASMFLGNVKFTKTFSHF